MKKELMKKTLTRSGLLLFGVSIFFLCCSFSCKNEIEESPMKTSAYWTSPVMSPDEALALARHDIVIIDLENMVNNKESLQIMKKLNDDIKLICYSNPMEIWDPMPEKRSLQTSWANEIKARYSQWLLKTGSGSNCVFWPGMLMLNLSETCPPANTEFGALRYNQWMARKLMTQVLSDPIWDGYFMDNCTPNISWVCAPSQEQIDIDANGVSDNPWVIDASWKNGITSFLNSIRQNSKKDFLLFGNKGVLDFAHILDGIMFEGFPNDYLGSKMNGGWDQCIANAEKMPLGRVKYVIFQAASMSDFNLALASSLLFDHTYVALGQDNISFPEVLKTNPGKPSGEATKNFNGIWLRDYEGASVEVYPPGRKGVVRPIEKGLGTIALEMGAQ